MGLFIGKWGEKKKTFVNHGTIDTRCQVILHDLRSCSGHCRAFSSIPGFYQIEASDTPTSPLVMTTKTISRHYRMSLGDSWEQIIWIHDGKSRAAFGNTPTHSPSSIHPSRRCHSSIVVPMSLSIDPETFSTRHTSQPRPSILLKRPTHPNLDSPVYALHLCSILNTLYLSIKSPDLCWIHDCPGHPCLSFHWFTFKSLSMHWRTFSSFLRDSWISILFIKMQVSPRWEC